MHRRIAFGWCTWLAVAFTGTGPLRMHEATAAPTVAVCRPGEYDSSHHDFAGRPEPADLIAMRAPAAGVVKSVHVRPGTAVHKGEVLFEFTWTPPISGNRIAESLVHEAEQEVKRWSDALDRARKLSESPPEEIRKQYGAALDGLKKPLDKTVKQIPAVLAVGLAPSPRDAVQKLYVGLDRSLRLANARSGPALDVPCELELTKLRPAIVRTVATPDSLGKGPAGEKFVTDLRELLQDIDRACVLSHARSKEGIEALAAERDLAAVNLKIAQDKSKAQQRDIPPDHVVAPVDAQVVRVEVKAGDSVDGAARAATLLCVLAPAGTLHVTFDMDEALLERLQQSVRAGKVKAKTLSEVPVELALLDEREFAHAGKLDYVDTRLDPKSHRVRCRAVFPDWDGALTNAAFAASNKGKRLRVQLTLGEPKKVLLIPRQSILTDAEGKTQVLVVNDKNRVEYRSIRAGGEYADLREVIEGLRDADWVVIGSELSRKASTGTDLKSRDFVKDLRLLDLKPGSIVEPVHVPLPEPDGTERPKP